MNFIPNSQKEHVEDTVEYYSENIDEEEKTKEANSRVGSNSKD